MKTPWIEWDKQINFWKNILFRKVFPIAHIDYKMIRGLIVGMIEIFWNMYFEWLFFCNVI